MAFDYYILSLIVLCLALGGAAWLFERATKRPWPRGHIHRSYWSER